MSRRQRNKAMARLEQRRRAAARDFDVAHCGDFNRAMKWVWGGRDRFLGRPDVVEELVFGERPFFGLIPRL